MRVRPSGRDMKNLFMKHFYTGLAREAAREKSSATFIRCPARYNTPIQSLSEPHLSESINLIVYYSNLNTFGEGNKR